VCNPSEGKQRLAPAHRSGLAVLALVAALTTSPAVAQPPGPYPDKPIRIIVPFAPGGSTDVIARVIGQKVTEAWGQPVIIDTRPGGSTIIGTAMAAKADPDGYTLLMTVSNLVTTPALHATAPFDALRDFEPISLLARAPVTIYTHPSFPPTDLKGLIALAKAKPGTLNFGSAGPASMTHLTAELIKMQNGLDMTHVVYRGGAPALNDLIAGHLPMQFATVLQALSQYQAGQLRSLGVAAAARSKSLPEVPTFREQGFDIVVTEWYGLLAPAGTPKPVIAKLSAEMKRVLALPDVTARLGAIEMVASTPEELAAFLRSESERWVPIIRKLGLKAD
jgi:tripartite-type tricarboxylate transporter receptor subunit TctC